MGMKYAIPINCVKFSVSSGKHPDYNGDQDENKTDQTSITKL